METSPVFTPVVFDSIPCLQLDLPYDSDASGLWCCDIPGWFVRVPVAVIRIPLEKLKHAVMVVSANDGLFTSVSVKADIDCPGFDGKVSRAEIRINCRNDDFRDMTAVFMDDESGAEMSLDLLGFWPDIIGAENFAYYLKSI